MPCGVGEHPLLCSLGPPTESFKAGAGTISSPFSSSIVSTSLLLTSPYFALGEITILKLDVLPDWRPLSSFPHRTLFRTSNVSSLVWTSVEPCEIVIYTISAWT